MKKLSNLKGVILLSKTEQKSIGGGRWNCSCTGSVGQWSGNYATGNDAVNAISEWCSSGLGTCTQGYETVGIYLA